MASSNEKHLYNIKFLVLMTKAITCFFVILYKELRSLSILNTNFWVSNTNCPNTDQFRLNHLS